MRTVCRGLLISMFVQFGVAQDGASAPAHAMADMSMQDISGMEMGPAQPGWMPSLDAGSGTGWEPASAPVPMWMISRAGWSLMAHGVIFLDYNQQGGPRGSGKAESVIICRIPPTPALVLSPPAS